MAADRTAAAASMAEGMRQLKRCKDNANRNMRVLKVKYERCVEAKELLLEKHFQYGERAKIDIQSAEMTEWLNPQIDEAEDLLDEVFLLLDADETRLSNEQTEKERTAAEEAETKQKETQLNFITKQSETDSKLLKDNVTNMKAVIDDEDKTSKEDALLVQASLQEIESILEGLTKSWNFMKAEATDDDLREDIIKTETETRKLVSDNRTTAHVFIKTYNPTIINDDAVSVSSRSSSDTTSSSRDLSVKLQKINLPSFNGNGRAFARFKGDFNRIVAPSYPDKQHLTYVIKEQCLKGQAKTLVENIDNIDEIWSRLEEKYGRTTDIVRLVLNDVKKLSFQKIDKDVALITLVDTLEKGIQDLTLIKAQAEISTEYTVNLIEEKLPRRILEKWLTLEREEVTKSKESEKTTSEDVTVKVEEVTGARRFNQLLKFLKEERRQAERMMQLHGRDKEKEKDKDNNEKDKNKQNKDNNKYRSNLIDGKPAINNKNKCLLHPNGTHLTRMCRVFQGKTAEERGKIVKDLSGCRLCLSTSHVGQRCPFEDTWKGCDISGCGVKHSRLLHGCGIPEFSMHVQVFNVSVVARDRDEEENTDHTPQTFTYNNKNNTLLLMQEHSPI